MGFSSPALIHSYSLHCFPISAGQLLVKGVKVGRKRIWSSTESPFDCNKSGRVHRSAQSNSQTASRPKQAKVQDLEGGTKIPVMCSKGLAMPAALFNDSPLFPECQGG